MSWLKWFSNQSLTGPPQFDPSGLPSTYAQFPADDGAVRPDVFEPALKQFGHAFRSGEPTFRDDSMRPLWQAARRDATIHVLRMIAASSWKDHLVLRGSILLKAWLGELAREPGDLDWVVTSSTLNVQEFEYFGELVRGIARACRAKDVEFLPDQIAIDDIWTYDRAPGRRLVIPWRAIGLPGGVVQSDFVYGERMPVPPQRILIRLSAGDDISVLAASRELSLAWKLVWLETDMYPQGKDLYDATLLAERIRLSDELLRRVFDEHGCKTKFHHAAELPPRWQIDWESFRREYPNVEGDAKYWQERLAAALRNQRGDEVSK